MTKFLRATFISALITLLSLYFVSCNKKSAALPSYDISVAFDGETLSGSTIYTFEKETNVIEFNLYGNAYREGAKLKPNAPGDDARAYPYGVSYGETVIGAVSVDGENADYELIGEDLNVLSVSLPSRLSGKISVKIDFSTKIPKTDNRLGISGDIVRLTDCFPVACAFSDGEYFECEYSPFGDPYYAAASDYKISLTVPSTYVVASSGSPCGTEINGDNTEYLYKLSGGRDFAFALSENYVVTSQKADDVDLYYYAKENREKEIEVIKAAIEYFSEIFGDYAYTAFSVAETPLVAAGMEFSGMCYIDENLSEENKILALVHETAHEWWHAAVGFNEIREAYLDEGLAEFSSYLFFKNNGYTGIADKMLENAKSAYKSFFDIKTLLAGEADTSMKRNLKDFKSEYEYVNIAYNKSLIMFYEYQKAVGEKRAVAGLSKFYKSNLFKSVGQAEVIKVLGLEEFFNSYISGKVLI